MKFHSQPKFWKQFYKTLATDYIVKYVEGALFPFLSEWALSARRPPVCTRCIIIIISTVFYCMRPTELYFHKSCCEVFSLSINLLPFQYAVADGPPCRSRLFIHWDDLTIQEWETRRRHGERLGKK